MIVILMAICIMVVQLIICTDDIRKTKKRQLLEEKLKQKELEILNKKVKEIDDKLEVIETEGQYKLAVKDYGLTNELEYYIIGYFEKDENGNFNYIGYEVSDYIKKEIGGLI